MALIAQLSPYQLHAHTLFLQAVSLCEEVVAKDGRQSKKEVYHRYPGPRWNLVG